MLLDVDFISYLCGTTENNTLLFNNLLERQKTDLTGFFVGLLKKPKTAKFIRKCIENGIDFNTKTNDGDYPIHFLMESLCVENLKEIESLIAYKCMNSTQINLFELYKPKSSPYVNVKNQNDQNSLHILANKVTNENYVKIFEMMQILLKHGCNANSPDNEGKTPFFIILKKAEKLEKGLEIVKYFIDNSDIDVITHKSDEFRELIVKFKRKFGIDINQLCERKMLKRSDSSIDSDETVILQIIETNELEKVDFETLEKLLDSGEINEFETKFSQLQKEDKEKYREYCSLYLEFAVEFSLINIVDLLIRMGADVNYVPKSSKLKIPPAFICCETFNFGILKSFLHHPETKLWYEDENIKMSLLHKICSSKSSNLILLDEFLKQQNKCFDLILEKCDVELINRRDEHGRAAIYYSIHNVNKHCTNMLLQKGADIDTFKNEIKGRFYSDFLDSRFSTENESDDAKDFATIIDYGFLLSSQPNDEEKVKIDPEKLPLNKKQEESHGYCKEMRVLKEVASNDELEHLLAHPVFTTFIFLKWNKIIPFVYLNLFLTLLYMFSFIPYVVFYRDSNSVNNILRQISYIVSIIGISLITIRESVQFFLSFRYYICRKSNFIDISSLIASIILLFFNDEISDGNSRMLRIFVITLFTCEYYKLLGAFPPHSVSLYTKMFRNVLGTFLRSISIFSVMLVAFALNFYTLHGDKYSRMMEKARNLTANGENDEKIEEPEDNDVFNNFGTFGYSILKVLVMQIGEFDASEIHLDGFKYAAVFVTFIFLMTIVLNNLLTALAITDSQDLKHEAELFDLKQKVFAMYKIENAIFSRNWKFIDFMRKSVTVFPKDITERKIIFDSNTGFYFEINGERIPIRRQWKLKFIKKQNKKFCPEILKKIRKILEMKSKKQNKEKILKKLLSITKTNHELIIDIQKSVKRMR